MVPHGHCFSQNGALSTKGALFWCPCGTVFQQKKVENGAPGAPKQYHFARGHRFQTFFWKMVPFFLNGHCFSVPLALFLYRKCIEKQCPFGKWHQNGAPKGTVLQTIKQCLKGTILVPLIFLCSNSWKEPHFQFKVVATEIWQQFFHKYVYPIQGKSFPKVHVSLSRLRYSKVQKGQNN